MIAVIVGLITAGLVALARWWHGRAVITAEQRGRLDAIAETERRTRAAEAERARAVDALERAADHSAAGARASVPAGAVTTDEVDAWAQTPKGPAS